jgi:serine protease Do
VNIGELDQDALALAGRDEPQTSSGETASDLGVTVETLTPELAGQLDLSDDSQGVVVTQVEPGSLAARAMIRPQDVIVSVGDQQVETAKQFRDAVEAEDPEEGIRLRVMRDGFSRFVLLRKR